MGFRTSELDVRIRRFPGRLAALAAFAALASAACDGGGVPPTLGPHGANSGQGPQVKFDLFATPLPEVPLPNDIATRPDANSPTGRRLNAAVLVAPTDLERDVRRKIDKLDGWGVYGGITVGFTNENADSDPDAALLDLADIRNRHAGDDFAFANDAVYLVNVDPRYENSADAAERAEYGMPVALDLGEGQFPPHLQEPDRYYENDPRGTTSNIMLETIEEDLNGDGRLQPEEDTDFDGVLDHPNTFSGNTDTADNPEDLVTFYEKETDTLIIRPVVPLRERTRYAVVLTKRLRGANGHPVRSPFPYFHHVDQAADLADLGTILSGRPDIYGPDMDERDVAFAWTFTTQSVRQDIIELRRGLDGEGAFARLADEYPPEVFANVMWECNPSYPDSCTGENALPANVYVVSADDLAVTLRRVAEEVFDLSAIQADPLLRTYQFVKYFVFGWVTSPQFLDNDGDGWEEEAWDVNWKTGRGNQTPGRVNFIAVVPKDEYRRAYNLANGKPEDAPAPVVFYGHGYTGFRVEPLGFGGSLAKYGLTTVGWDCVHHGSALGPTLRDVAMGIFQVEDLTGAGHALLDDRAVDLDNDKFDGRGTDAADLQAPPCGRRPCIPTMHFDVPFSQFDDEVAHLPGGLDTDRQNNAWLGRWDPATGRWTPNVMYQDDEEDSASDFWTAYVFHTRDVVRQSALDLIRIIQVFQSFDGTRLAAFDVDGDGEREQYDFNADGTPDLAGDFDGVGGVDFGGPDNDYYVWGQSLGGIMSGVLGGTHPDIRAVAPVAGGGGLGDVGIRSTQGGVKEAVILRMMGPLVVTVPAASRFSDDAADNETACCAAGPGATCDPSIVSLRFLVPQQNNTGEVEIACLNTGNAGDFAIAPGDVVVVRNMRRPDEPRCSVADGEMRTRISIPSDLHDPLEILVYDASTSPTYALERASDCKIAAGVGPRTVRRTVAGVETDVDVIDTFEVPRQTFEWDAYDQGAPLVSVAEGFGLRRGTPEARRFMGIAQLVLDPGDPAVYAPHYRNSMVIATVGDMNVPVNTGISISRTAGSLLFDASAVDPAWEDIDVGLAEPLHRPGGRTPNRVLLDAFVINGLERMVPWRGTSPTGPLFDADDLSGGTDGFGQPRLSPALRTWRPSAENGAECVRDPSLCCGWTTDGEGSTTRVECPRGVSALVLPYISADGDHGFGTPDESLAFDVNTFMINMIGRYFQTQARVLEYAPCMHDNDITDPACSFIPPLPYGPDWPPD